MGLMVNFHLVGDHRALLIAERFDFGDGEISTMEFGQRFLEGGMQIVLKRESCRRGKDAGIHAICDPVSVFGNKLDLARCDGRSALWFVMEPCSWGNERENQNENDGEVVLPGSSLVGPEKRAGQNLAKVRHV